MKLTLVCICADCDSLSEPTHSQCLVCGSRAIYPLLPLLNHQPPSLIVKGDLHRLEQISNIPLKLS